MERDDLSDKLIHLTRGEDRNAAAAFVAIMNERRIRGGTGQIRGRHRCVCFSEAPVSKLAQILVRPSVHEMRYSPFGIMLDKAWLFERGGRPVIYQSDKEYELLCDSQKFRHVRYEPGVVDFTWEREWRVQIDELPIDPAHTTLVVPTREWEAWAQRQHMGKVSSKAILLQGFIGPSDLPWHFVVLSDLGVDVAGVSPPPQ